MSLYIVKSMGGGNVFITQGEFEEGELDNVIESCGKLITSQSYVRSFKVHNGEKIDIDLDKWRTSKYFYRKTLLDLMCRAQAIKLPRWVDPWINVPPHPEFGDKIVVHRRISKVTERANSMFNWKKIIDTFGVENFVFVSRLKYEWEEFGFPEVEYFYPKDMYEHAQTIKACKLFVGNQSLPAAVADALGVDRIFELALGIDRNHCLIHYANNAWYFASPWVSTFKHFRFAKNNNGKGYLDLLNGGKVKKLNKGEELKELCSSINLELGFRKMYSKFLLKRYIDSTIDFWKRFTY